jgi:hypothetical protein
MKEVIQKYKKLIFVWITVCLIGTMINILDVRGYIPSKMGETSISIFSSDNHDATQRVWPFVKFVEEVDMSRSYVTNQYNYTRFNGIFYGFDTSEMVVYILLLLGFLTYKAYIVTPAIKEKVSNL